METAYTIQLSQRGIITLPKSLRQRYSLQTGDIISLIDLGGVLSIRTVRKAHRRFPEVADEL